MQMNRETLIEAYRQMRTIRVFEERVRISVKTATRNGSNRPGGSAESGHLFRFIRRPAPEVSGHAWGRTAAGVGIIS